MIATDVTPLPALAGGALTNLAATLLYAAPGRIAGISGIAMLAGSQLARSQARA